MRHTVPALVFASSAGALLVPLRPQPDGAAAENLVQLLLGGHARRGVELDRRRQVLGGAGADGDGAALSAREQQRPLVALERPGRRRAERQRRDLLVVELPAPEPLHARCGRLPAAADALPEALRILHVEALHAAVGVAHGEAVPAAVEGQFNNLRSLRIGRVLDGRLPDLDLLRKAHDEVEVQCVAEGGDEEGAGAIHCQRRAAHLVRIDTRRWHLMQREPLPIVARLGTEEADGVLHAVLAAAAAATHDERGRFLRILLGGQRQRRRGAAEDRVPRVEGGHGPEPNPKPEARP
mmetsp:Transcript_10029/g.29645  ORF Transcript_10029/g.29645 Transcript_10029/m.29645 type:complete len:295 (-) Transcript_10029:225-1109(-)